jgi:hypothetical protein
MYWKRFTRKGRDADMARIRVYVSMYKPDDNGNQNVEVKYRLKIDPGLFSK